MKNGKNKRRKIRYGRIMICISIIVLIICLISFFIRDKNNYMIDVVNKNKDIVFDFIDKEKRCKFGKKKFRP